MVRNRGRPCLVLFLLALAMVLSATTVGAMNPQITFTLPMITVPTHNGGGSSVDVGDTAAVCSGLATPPATTMAIASTAVTAFTANAPEESKAIIANDRTVTLSSSGPSLIDTTVCGKEDGLDVANRQTERSYVMKAPIFSKTMNNNSLVTSRKYCLV